MDVIVYVANDHGIDGSEKAKPMYAAWSKDTLSVMFAGDRGKSYRTLDKVIVDTDVAVAQALAKLNGIDRLVLNLPPWPANKLNTKEPT